MHHRMQPAMDNEPPQSVRELANFLRTHTPPLTSYMSMTSELLDNDQVAEEDEHFGGLSGSSSTTTSTATGSDDIDMPSSWRKSRAHFLPLMHSGRWSRLKAIKGGSKKNAQQQHQAVYQPRQSSLDRYSGRGTSKRRGSDATTASAVTIGHGYSGFGGSNWNSRPSTAAGTSTVPGTTIDGHKHIAISIPSWATAGQHQQPQPQHRGRSSSIAGNGLLPTASQQPQQQQVYVPAGFFPPRESSRHPPAHPTVGTTRQSRPITPAIEKTTEVTVTCHARDGPASEKANVTAVVAAAAMAPPTMRKRASGDRLAQALPSLPKLGHRRISSNAATTLTVLKTVCEDSGGEISSLKTLSSARSSMFGHNRPHASQQVGVVVGDGSGGYSGVPPPHPDEFLNGGATTPLRPPLHHSDPAALPRRPSTAPAPSNTMTQQTALQHNDAWAAFARRGSQNNSDIRNEDDSGAVGATLSLCNFSVSARGSYVPRGAPAVQSTSTTATPARGPTLTTMSPVLETLDEPTSSRASATELLSPHESRTPLGKNAVPGPLTPVASAKSGCVSHKPTVTPIRTEASLEALSARIELVENDDDNNANYDEDNTNNQKTDAVVVGLLDATAPTMTRHTFGSREEVLASASDGSDAANHYRQISRDSTIAMSVSSACGGPGLTATSCDIRANTPNEEYTTPPESPSATAPEQNESSSLSFTTFMVVASVEPDTASVIGAQSSSRNSQFGSPPPRSSRRARRTDTSKQPHDTPTPAASANTMVAEDKGTPPSSPGFLFPPTVSNTPADAPPVSVQRKYGRSPRGSVGNEARAPLPILGRNSMLTRRSWRNLSGSVSSTSGGLSHSQVVIIPRRGERVLSPSSSLGGPIPPPVTARRSSLAHSSSVGSSRNSRLRSPIPPMPSSKRPISPTPLPVNVPGAPRPIQRRPTSNRRALDTPDSLRPPTTPAAHGLGEEKNDFSGADGKENDDDLANLSRDELLARYQSLRDQHMRETERRLRQLERNGEQWMRSLTPLLADINRTLADLEVDEESGSMPPPPTVKPTLLPAAGPSPESQQRQYGQPQHQQRRSSLAAGRPRSSHSNLTSSAFDGQDRFFHAQPPADGPVVPRRNSRASEQESNLRLSTHLVPPPRSALRAGSRQRAKSMGMAIKRRDRTGLDTVELLMRDLQGNSRFP